MKMFDAGKTRMVGRPCGEKKLCQYVKPFSSDAGALGTDGQTDRRTDGRTERIAISISRVSVLTKRKLQYNYTYK